MEAASHVGQVLRAPELQPDEAQAWVDYARLLMSRNYARFCWVIGGLFLLWWPLDFVLFDDARALAGMAAMRVIAIGGAALMGGTARGRALLSRRPMTAGYAGLCAGVAAIGWVLGGFGSLADGWAHYCCVPPVLLIGFAVRPPARALLGLGFIGASLGGFFLARPADLLSPQLPILLACAAASLLVYTFVGQIAYVLVLSDFVQRRRVGAHERALAELTRQLEQRVAEQTSELRALALDLQRRRDEERRWIAREMHDELGQEIAALGYELAYARRRLGESGRPGSGGGSSGAPAEIEGVAALVERTRGTLRRILSRLEPEPLQALDLPGALDALVARTAALGGPRLSVACQLGAEPLPRATAAAAYRVVQEALTNVLKHAEATQASVTVERDERGLHLRVLDDGVGVDGPPRARAGAGMGLVGLRERAAELGGEIRIGPAAGGGTELRCTLPAREAAAP